MAISQIYVLFLKIPYRKENMALIKSKREVKKKKNKAEKFTQNTFVHNYFEVSLLYIFR